MTQHSNLKAKFGKLAEIKPHFDRFGPVGSSNHLNTNSDFFSEHNSFRFSQAYYSARRFTLSSLFNIIGNDETKELNKAKLISDIELHARQTLTNLKIRISATVFNGFIQDLANDLIGFGPLEDLLKQDSITDIMIVGPKHVYFEVHGSIEQSDIQFEDEAHLRSICQRIARRIGRRVDESSPMCDARLPDGSRVNIVVPPLAIDGTTLTIRKFQRDRLSFQGLIEMGALDPKTMVLLNRLVQIRCNILVVGGTGSGKTTLLNCLNQTLPSKERIVTCEDAAELQLQQPHVVRLETRASNIEGSGEVPMRALIRNSLRMRPDRIIVGEIRGEEAFDFIQAMNTGHVGSMGTMHANSAADALSRLEGLISLGAPALPSRTIQQMINSAIDIIIEVRRYPDGKRRIAEILEITKWTEDGVQFHPLLKFKQDTASPVLNISGHFEIFSIEAPHIQRKAAHMNVDLQNLISDSART